MRVNSNFRILGIGILFSLIAIASLATGNAIDLSEKAPPNPASQSFRIVGFLYNLSYTDQIQFDKLTHINAFLYLEPDGNFSNLKSLGKLKNLVKEAHDNGVKVSIAVGGRVSVLEGLTADTNTRKTFVDKLLRCVNDYDLDGVDIDWEYPTNETSDNYLALLQELRKALPRNKGGLLTSDVNAVGDVDISIPSEVFGIVDFLNIMAYDKNHADHSPYSYAEEAIDYWSSRGLTADKMVLGVPFYSQPDGIHYSKLIQTNPAAANWDEFYFNGSWQYYNGIPTIQKKTKLAISRTGGIMILELDYDTKDNTSLLNAIFEAVHGREDFPEGFLKNLIRLP